MTIPPTKAARAVFLLPILALAGCGFSPPLSTAQRDAQQSCKEDANRIYNTQNRYQLSERPSPDTPYSGATPPPLPGDGLSDQYSFDNMVSSCLARSEAVPAAGDTPAN
jgi:hypothetical protein